MRIGSIAALLLAFAQPALAQDPGRELVVTPTSAWQHAETEIILPPRVAGLTRGALRDLGEGEMDVVVQYAGGADGVFATVYLFKTQTHDVPLWFDRALTAIMLRPEHGLTAAAGPAPTPFARPGTTIASGLRATVDLAAPELRSTGVAIAPLGLYLVKIRISSATLDRAALDERLSRFVAGLRWPAPAGGERAAVAILPCPEPLRLRNARLVRVDTAATLMDAVSGVAAADDQGRPPPVYCREPGATLQYGVYRPNRARDSYLVALDDAGISLWLGEAMDLSELMGGGSSGRRYAMTLLGRDMTTVLPSFNRLPPPAQAVSVALGHRGETLSVSIRDPEPPR